MKKTSQNKGCDDNQHRVFLAEAVTLAARARAAGDHPFGAVLVRNGKVVASAGNRVNTDHSALHHAEFLVLEAANRSLDKQAMSECTLYASTEPCAMCCGALYWAGVRRVVYAFSASQLAELAGGSLLLPSRELLGHAREPVEIIGPVPSAEAAAVHDGFWATKEPHGGAAG